MFGFKKESPKKVVIDSKKAVCPYCFKSMGAKDFHYMCTSSLHEEEDDPIRAEFLHDDMYKAKAHIVKNPQM